MEGATEDGGCMTSPNSFRNWNCRAPGDAGKCGLAAKKPKVLTINVQDSQRSVRKSSPSLVQLLAGQKNLTLAKDIAKESLQLQHFTFRSAFHVIPLRSTVQVRSQSGGQRCGLQPR